MCDDRVKEKLLYMLHTHWHKLTKEQQESIELYAKLLYEMQGLPVEQQQEIIDNIRDPLILDFLEQEKKKLS